jgi:hypothetical protein
MHGRAARKKVRVAIARWSEVVSQSSGLDPLAYADRLLHGTSFGSSIATWAPDVAQEIGGIAEGAELDERLVLAYNLMDEQWWFDLGPSSSPGACSVLVHQPDPGSDDASLVLAQNMDLPAFMTGSQVLLHIVPPGGVESFVLSSAGLIGLTGVNRSGVGVCVNTLLMLKHSDRGLPVAFVVRQALTYTTLGGAVDFIRRVPHASGQHYALANSCDSIGLEASGVGVTPYHSPGGSSWAHTNHPLASTDADAVANADPTIRSRSTSSVARLRFLEAARERHLDGSELKALLADRTVPICVSPIGQRASETFGSVIFKLSDPPLVEICLGRPDQSEWFRPGWDARPIDG